MLNPRIHRFVVYSLATTLILSSCAIFKSGYSVPTRHPEELSKGRPVCSDCHEAGKGAIPYARFNHTATFGGNHRNEAYQSAKMCSMCHDQSFCNDCHATRVEVKPSAKDPMDTYRSTPHRGDYLSRHRIEARVDPTSCFRCHGNPKASKTCITCHGK